jgi:hypothetical protein
LVNRLSAVYLRYGPSTCRTRASLDPGTSELHRPLKTHRLHPRLSCSPRTATRSFDRTQAAQATLVHLGMLRQRCPSPPPPGQEAFMIFSVTMPRVMLRHYPTPPRRATIRWSTSRPRSARPATNDGPSTFTTVTPPGPAAGTTEWRRQALTLLLNSPFHADEQWNHRRKTEWLTFWPRTIVPWLPTHEPGLL